MPGVPAVGTVRGFPKGKQRLRNHTQPGAPLEAGARNGAQPDLSGVNMGLSAASLFLFLLFIPKINCFLFQSPAKPDDGSSFRASSFNNIVSFAFPPTKLQFGVKPNFDIPLCIQNCTAQSSNILPFPQLFAYRQLCCPKIRSPHYLHGLGFATGKQSLSNR